MIDLKIQREAVTEIYRNMMLTRWGGKKSSKGVDYMDHVDGGLAVLDFIKASYTSKWAFCLHGLFQSDEDLFQTISEGLHTEIDEKVLIYVMEYRRVANMWLSVDPIQVKPAICSEVISEMLIADKVQNYANLKANYQDHKRYGALEKYFKGWLEHLDVFYQDFEHLPLLGRRT